MGWDGWAQKARSGSQGKSVRRRARRNAVKAHGRGKKLRRASWLESGYSADSWGRRRSGSWWWM